MFVLFVAFSTSDSYLSTLVQGYLHQHSFITDPQYFSCAGLFKWLSGIETARGDEESQSDPKGNVKWR